MTARPAPVRGRHAPVDVVVVGSGPNGLAAAVVLARAGLQVRVLEAQPALGGGARTVPGLTEGLVHDLCSSVHPLALASPFFRGFDLEARGVELLVPDVSYAQPLDDGRAALAYRSLERTVAGLGRDGPRWRALLEPLVERVDGVVELLLGDHRRPPRDLVAAARVGLGVVEQGLPWVWNRRFEDEEAAALLTGVAAHAITPLPSAAAAGTALMLGMLGHATGWCIPRGGTRAITEALVADLLAHGGEVVTDHPVRSYDDLGPARAHVFDTTPRTVVEVLGDRLPTASARALRRFRYGNAAAKVDFVLSGPVPWRNPEVGLAGTVHVGGSRATMARAEHAVARGRHPERPMVLLSDPAVTDPSRVAPDGTRPLWTYAHVPAGSARDVTPEVVREIEHFAPGFRDLIVTSRCVPAARMSDHNENYVDGDIASGAVTLSRVLLGPRPLRDPYATGAPGVYLCSQSAPPGPGVHGMGGWHAARRVLRDVFGVRTPPDLSPAR